MAYSDKDQERQDLLHFLSARRSATGEELTLLVDDEAPDFICQRADGRKVGIEHTKIEYNPERTELRHACKDYDVDIDNFAIMWAAFVTLAKKERKRRKSHWKLPDATILVFDLAEGYRFESWPEKDSFSDDYSDSGFIEVWISDHSSLDAYGEVTAIGLFPKSIWGIRGQGYLRGIPYK
jgi:hypothetical protein